MSESFSWPCGGTADMLDLKSGAVRREGSTPFGVTSVCQRNVGQLVGRLVRDQEVAGSSPVIPTMFSFTWNVGLEAAII